MEPAPNIEPDVVSGAVIKVALVEDNSDQRDALRFLIKGSPGFACLGAFSTAEEALDKIPLLKPDVVLMDIHLPGMSGTECVRRLKACLPAVRIMMLTVFEDHDRIFEALRAGASAYLLKNTAPARLLEAIQELQAGGAPMSGPIARQVVAAFQQPANGQGAHDALSPREQEVLELLNRGYLYKEIADLIGISLGTVNTHIARIYEKLHVHSRAGAMLKIRPGAPRD
jgi:DNA-binding NarL/FixJ family response regulator